MGQHEYQNPDYSDVKYVEALVGPDTVNTIPMETLEAYRDHGNPEYRLEDDLDKANQVLDSLPELDIDLKEVTQQLEDEGVEKFNKPYDKLMNTLEEQKKKALSLPINRMQANLGVLESKVQGYRNEDDVSPDSLTETYAALKFFVDNWRWQDVPFYVRTGKRMPKKTSVITIQFRPVPHKSFPEESLENWHPNRLIISIQPEKGMRLRFQAKQPGLEMLLNPVDMTFNYDRTYDEEPPEAYETLLLDVMEADATLFMRNDQVEAAWDILMPIISVWESTIPVDFPNYEAGTLGPEDAEALIAKDGNHWVMLPLNTTQDEQGKSK